MPYRSLDFAVFRLVKCQSINVSFRSPGYLVNIRDGEESEWKLGFSSQVIYIVN